MDSFSSKQRSTRSYTYQSTACHVMQRPHLCANMLHWRHGETTADCDAAPVPRRCLKQRTVEAYALASCLRPFSNSSHYSRQAPSSAVPPGLCRTLVTGRMSAHDWLRHALSVVGEESDGSCCYDGRCMQA
eukprot:3048080-Pleurochrysis_carterae.AAC.3